MSALSLDFNAIPIVPLEFSNQNDYQLNLIYSTTLRGCLVLSKMTLSILRFQRRGTLCSRALGKNEWRYMRSKRRSSFSGIGVRYNIHSQCTHAVVSVKQPYGPIKLDYIGHSRGGFEQQIEQEKFFIKLMTKNIIKSFERFIMSR